MPRNRNRGGDTKQNLSVMLQQPKLHLQHERERTPRQIQFSQHSSRAIWIQSGPKSRDLQVVPGFISRPNTPEKACNADSQIGNFIRWRKDPVHTMEEAGQEIEMIAGWVVQLGGLTLDSFLVKHQFLRFTAWIWINSPNLRVPGCRD